VSPWSLGSLRAPLESGTSSSANGGAVRPGRACVRCLRPSPGGRPPGDDGFSRCEVPWLPSGSQFLRADPRLPGFAPGHYLVHFFASPPPTISRRALIISNVDLAFQHGRHPGARFGARSTESCRGLSSPGRTKPPFSPVSARRWAEGRGSAAGFVDTERNLRPGIRRRQAGIEPCASPLWVRLCGSNREGRRPARRPRHARARFPGFAPVAAWTWGGSSCLRLPRRPWLPAEFRCPTDRGRVC